MRGPAGSGGAADGTGGVSAALAAAVSCTGFLPGAGRAGCAEDDPEAGGAPPAGSALEERSGPPRAELRGS